MGRRTTRLQGDGGSVMAIIALSLVFLMVFAAFAVDLGNHRQSKNQVDSTADAAALAGAQGLLSTTSGKAVPTALSGASNRQAIADAAGWAFNNLDINTIPTPSKCNVYPDTDTVTWCYNAGDTRNTVVQVSSPYVGTKKNADGTPYFKPKELVHVDVCYDVNYSIASVIGIKKARTCGHATGRGVNGVDQNSEDQDLVDDPLTQCADGTHDVFDAAHYFPGDGKLNADEDAGATFLDSLDLDKTSVKYWLDGVLMPSTDYTATINMTSKNATPPPYKYEIKWRTPKAGSTPPKLANGPHTVFMIAKNADGSGCQTKSWTFNVGSQTANTSQSECQEDLFRGTEFPADGSILDLSQADVQVGAEYWDETPMNGYINQKLDNYLQQWWPIFTIDGKDVLPSANITWEQPANGKGERKYKSRITLTVSRSQYSSGNHTIFLKAYDSDQNKKGGDCGIAKWTVNFTNGKKVIELVE